MQKQLGVWAEQQAAQLMQQQDFQLIARNWHSLYGELDLVMQREQELVFVEVKARAKTGYALAYESVSSAKQRKSYKRLYVLFKNPQFAHYYYRFDVICFDFNRYFAKPYSMIFLNTLMICTGLKMLLLLIKSLLIFE